MIIKRDNSRPVEDDFKLNVQPQLDRDPMKEAVEIIGKLDDKINICIGWKIQYKYE